MHNNNNYYTLPIHINQTLQQERLMMEETIKTIPRKFKEEIKEKGIRHFFIRHIFHKVEFEYEASRFTDDDITMGIALITGKVNHSRRLMKPTLKEGGITAIFSGKVTHIQMRYSNDVSEDGDVEIKPYEADGSFIGATKLSIQNLVNVFYRGSHLGWIPVVPAAQGARFLYRAIINGVMSKTYKFFIWSNYGTYTPYRMQREMHARLSYLIARDMDEDESQVFKHYKENKVKEIRLEENDPYTYLVTFVY